jgi:SAM-dependent methyltransferase
MNKTDTTKADLYSVKGLPTATRLGQIKQQAWAKKFIAHFLLHLPGDCCVVEIGPGRGDFARECQRRGWEYSGIEASQAFYGPLKEMGIRVLQSRVPPIPLADASADLIHADQVIEHFNTTQDFTDFLAEAHRVLKPGGTLSLACPNLQTMGHLFYDCDYTHRLGFTKNNLERACLDYGFKVNVSTHYINLFLGSGLAYHCVRQVLIACLKIVNVALVAEIIDNIRFTKNLRKRVTKTLFDNVYVQAQRPTAA